MKKTILASGLLASAAMGLCAEAACAQAVGAQASAEKPAANVTADVGDIVVTARKRDETSMAVPVVVTAVGGPQLQQRGIVNLDGIARIVPQLLIANQGGSVQGGNIALRGISGPDSNPFGDQAVSFNIDGVQVAKANVRRMSDTDISQVEVLKGPQALFFGKNSPAGIVSIRTNDPGDHFEMGVTAGYEFEAREQRIEGFVSTPITDTLGVRFAGIYSGMNGYLDDLTPRDSPYYTGGHNPNSESYALRGTLLWKPMDSFSARLKVNYARVDANGPQAAGAFVSCPAGVRQTGSGIDQCKASDGANSNAGYGTFLSTIPGTLNHFRADGKNFLTQKQFLGSLELNYNLSDTIKITSVTGYYDVKLDQCQNYESDPSILLPSCNVLDDKEFSQELRFSTDFGGMFDFAGGLYFADTRASTGSLTYLYGGTFDLLGPGFGGPTTPAQINNYFLKQKGKAYSAYGQIIFRPIDKIELTAGGRYSYEKKRLPSVRSGGGLGETFPSTTPTTILDASTEVPILIRKDHWKDFSPEITASFRPNQNLTIFGSYKEGFLSGGFNSSSVSFNQAASLDLSYNPQRINGFEAGVKTLLFHNRLRVNVAAYTYKVDDLQVTNFTNATSSIRNAGSVKIKGVEADFTYRTPIAGLSLNGAAAYNHGKYSKFSNAPCYNGQTPAQGCNIVNGNPVQNLDGTELIRAPKWNLNGGFDYSTPVGDRFKLSLSGSINYSSSYLTDASSAPQSRQPNYKLVDASIRFGPANDRWELALIGRNLTNEFIFVASPNVPFTGGGTGTAAGVLGDRFAALGRGREIMVRASVRLGN